MLRRTFGTDRTEEGRAQAAVATVRQDNDHSALGKDIILIGELVGHIIPVRFGIEKLMCFSNGAVGVGAFILSEDSYLWFFVIQLIKLYKGRITNGR
jgi:hypothetical protein